MTRVGFLKQIKFYDKQFLRTVSIKYILLFLFLNTFFPLTAFASNFKDIEITEVYCDFAGETIYITGNFYDRQNRVQSRTLVVAEGNMIRGGYGRRYTPRHQLGHEHVFYLQNLDGNQLSRSLPWPVLFF